MVNWLVDCFRFNGHLRSISVYFLKRGRKRRVNVDESKNVQKNPPTPTASAVGPCPTIIQIVGRPALEVYPGPSHTCPLPNAGPRSAIGRAPDS